MAGLFDDDSKGQFEGTAQTGRTDNHGRHSGDNGQMYGQYNQYSNFGNNPHEHLSYNCATGQTYYHGENVNEEEKYIFGLDRDENSLFRYSDLCTSDCDSCSWWYHSRCLRGNSCGANCSDYTTEEHTCSTCMYFEDTPGSNRKGDSWNGICNAYNGNPIRHDPSSHTCKAWS